MVDTNLMVAQPHDPVHDTSAESPTTPTCLLHLGQIVGQGAFSEVLQVETVRTVDPVVSCLVLTPALDECVVCETFASSLSVQGLRLVVKRLKDKTLRDQDMRPLALADLLGEVKVLLSLPRHNHIVALYGVSADQDSPNHTFLLLEQVDTTLDKCLERIRNTSGSRTGGSIFPLNRKSHAILATQRKRIQDYAVGVAQALQFLHKYGLVYRDLKPTNVGIVYNNVGDTAQPTVKLLDFGLVRPCTQWTRGVKDKYSAGTPRYMSPEQMFFQDHGQAADLHSFGIVLWQICTLRTPFANGITSKFLKQLIATDQKRPQLSCIQSPVVQELLTRCWSPDPSQRPPFHEIIPILQAI